ncbi:uncharacterized protein PAC_05374 [Phialocephala subalpina]|uniref:DUF6594 domain-containing protein n=1 Tax=Phialocephala subalpina TaxID=576137 RepID=A0A1L7WRS9_9HELO|nr:uncharacterized protein PAC_05374 [Phialocephala subalpina]
MQATIPPVAEGYPQIAHLMSEHRELGIFRRFETLNILGLLHMQAELMILEEKYYQLASTDEKCSSRAYRSRDWWTLTQLDSTGKREQWETLLQIREKLDKYSRLCPASLKDSSLTLSRQISACNDKSISAPAQLRILTTWCSSGIGSRTHNQAIFLFAASTAKHGARSFRMTLLQYSIEVLETPSHDGLSMHLFQDSMLALGIALPSEITQYKDSVIIKILNGVATIIASLIPISSIVLLYFVSSISARLGILTGFTALFSLCLVLVTSASRVEIFAATSA